MAKWTVRSVVSLNKRVMKGHLSGDVSNRVWPSHLWSALSGGGGKGGGELSTSTPCDEFNGSQPVELVPSPSIICDMVHRALLPRANDDDPVASVVRGRVRGAQIVAAGLSRDPSAVGPPPRQPIPLQSKMSRCIIKSCIISRYFLTCTFSPKVANF